MNLAYRPLVENPGSCRLLYEIYPTHFETEEGTKHQWFEIALHHEVREYRPHDDAETRKSSLLLLNVADHLVQQARSHAPFELEMPAAYYTLHQAGPRDRSRPGIALTLSLVFNGVEPNSPRKLQALLAQLRAELERLGVDSSTRSDDAG